MKKTDKAVCRRHSPVLRAAKPSTVLLDYGFMILGAAMYALSVNFFTAPNHIAPGGITGIATLLHDLLYLPIGITSLILNIPLFLWGALKRGFRFILRTVIASVIVSTLIDVFSLFGIAYEGDSLIASIIGGVISGIGLGIIFLRGGSTGGTDIIGQNLHDRFPFLSVGSIILIADAFVIVLSMTVYRSLDSGLYALIAIFASTKVIDAVVFGFSRDNGKLLIIITEDPLLMCRLLTRDAHMGVTLLSARGGYSGKEKGVILCAAHPRDVYRVRQYIACADPNAFVITADAASVCGLGFSRS